MPTLLLNRTTATNTKTTSGIRWVEASSTLTVASTFIQTRPRRGQTGCSRPSCSKSSNWPTTFSTTTATSSWIRCTSIYPGSMWSGSVPTRAMSSLVRSNSRKQSLLQSQLIRTNGYVLPSPLVLQNFQDIFFFVFTQITELKIRNNPFAKGFRNNLHGKK